MVDKLEAALAALEADGTIDSTELTNAEKAAALFAKLAELRGIENAEAEADAAAKLLEQKRIIYNQKKGEFMERAGIRFTEIADTAGTYELSNFIVDVTTAFTEVKNEMIAEAQGE